MAYLPFQDLKVVELTSVLAGPAVGMFFAELGATVIKIENKRTGGDVTRNWKAPGEATEGKTSAYYQSINWGKQEHLLDLTDRRDHSLALGYLETADVVLSNFKTGSAEKLGLGFSAVKAINPTVIYAHLIAFSENDDRPGFDVLLQAETGFLSMTGHPGGPPAKLPVALIDLLAAHQMKEAILIALLEKSRTGRGAYLRVSMARSAIASLANQASNYLNAGFIPGKMGTQHPNISPYGDIFQTADGKEIVLAVGTEQHFAALCTAIGQPGLATDARFSTNASRVNNRPALIQLLATAIGAMKRDVLLEMLQSAGVPAGQIRNMEEVFDLPLAQDMILTNTDDSRCVRTIGFDIFPGA